MAAPSTGGQAQRADGGDSRTARRQAAGLRPLARHQPTDAPRGASPPAAGAAPAYRRGAWRPASAAARGAHRPARRVVPADAARGARRPARRVVPADRPGAWCPPTGPARGARPPLTCRRCPRRPGGRSERPPALTFPPGRARLLVQHPRGAASGAGGLGWDRGAWLANPTRNPRPRRARAPLAAAAPPLGVRSRSLARQSHPKSPAAAGTGAARGRRRTTWGGIAEPGSLIPPEVRAGREAGASSGGRRRGRGGCGWPPCGPGRGWSRPGRRGPAAGAGRSRR